MKKIILVAVAALVSLSAFAQQGKLAAGVYGSYIAKNSGRFGVGAKVQYNVLDQIRPEASFTYFFKKDNTKMWEANLNVHYLFDLGAVAVYPLAGINYVKTKSSGTGVDLEDLYGDLDLDLDIDIPVPATPTSGSGSTGKIGANIGCGVEYPLSESIVLSAEVKYAINKTYDNALLIGAGVVFKF